MKHTKKETRQILSNLINNNPARFVPIEDENAQRFKYISVYRLDKYINDRIIALKRVCNKIISKPRLWTRNVDFVAIRNDTSIWFAEVMIEGVIINFVVWQLLGFDFTLLTAMAWGIAIKQSLSVYWRLRNNGATATIPTKNK